MKLVQLSFFNLYAYDQQKDLTLYRTISRKVFSYLKYYLGQDVPIQRLGLDEFFIDISNLLKNSNYNDIQNTHCIFDQTQLTDIHLKCISITSDIRKKIWDNFNLTCSAGISENIMLAKLVGGLHKPNQQAILNAVNHEQIQTFLDTFSLRKLNGKI